MKRIEKVLILILVIVFANYIIHLPMCVDDYVHKDSDIYSAQHMCRHSTLTKNAKGILKTDDIIETITAAIDAKNVRPIPTAENILKISSDI